MGSTTIFPVRATYARPMTTEIFQFIAVISRRLNSVTKCWNIKKCHERL